MHDVAQLNASALQAGRDNRLNNIMVHNNEVKLQQSTFGICCKHGLGGLLVISSYVICPYCHTSGATCGEHMQDVKS